jgi:uncharacterized protein (TIGR04141 family)
MKSAPEKITLAFFQIEKELFGNIPFEDITEIIVDHSGLEKQKMSKKDWGNYQIRIYFKTERRPPRWQAFFNGAVAPEEDMLKKKVEYASFICFIGCKENIFAIAGGQGSSVLQGFVVYNFGTEVLVRLIDKDSRVIKGLQDRGVTGTILGESKFFRGDQRMSDEDQFGKIYKAVQAELDKNILTKVFDFHATDLRRRKAGCMAKSSFQLNKNLDFKKMLAVCDSLNLILEKKPKFSLNKVIQIPNRGDLNKKLIEDLNAELLNMVYQDCLADIVPDFDFCNKEYEDYYSSSSCKIYLYKDELSYDEPPKLGELISDLKRKGRILLENDTQFRMSFLDLLIQTFDNDGERLTSGSVLDHFHGEVKFEGRTYFKIDERWYRVDSDFIRDLNKECKGLLSDYVDEHFMMAPFIGKREGDYNASFLGVDGFVVLDTITHNNIEFCDLLKFDGQNVYVIHVKQGFTNSIRELASQAIISARTLANDRLTGFKFINGIEDAARKGKKSENWVRNRVAAQKFPTNGLKSWFDTKPVGNIFFCLAILDKGNDRSLKNEIEKFDSEIAKFSIVALKREIIGLEFGFKIIQLRKK